MIASVMEELYWAADEKSIDFEAEGLDTPGADKLTAAVGESDLFTMVRNLVQNAVKYTPENGTKYPSQRRPTVYASAWPTAARGLRPKSAGGFSILSTGFWAAKKRAPASGFPS